MQSSEHHSALGRWRTVHRTADVRLRAYVHGFFASSSDLPHPLRERHLPGLEVPLVLNFGSPHWRLNATDERAEALNRAWVVGLHNRHHLSQAVGERHFMIVRFTPLGAHLFLGIPMHRLVNQTVNVADIDPSLARLIVDRVFVTVTWLDRFAAMEALIAERIDHRRIPDPVALIWNELTAKPDRVAPGLVTSIGRLTSTIDCSHRSVIAQFRTCIGFPPKTIARLQRFSRTLALLNGYVSQANEPATRPYIESEATAVRQRSAVRWADVATDGGYFDQPHLIKEFRHFAGATPANVARQLSY